MASRFGATIEHVKTDYAHDPNKTGLLSETRGAVGDIAAKTYDAISGVTASIIALPSSKEYTVVPRNGITSGTRAALANTFGAQWVEQGPLRIFNVVPKAITAVTEIPDGIIRDGIQVIGGGKKNDGTIVQIAA